MKNLKYPEYINGIKQVQNPIKRFFIKLFYSDWFRIFFMIIPIWLFIPLVFITVYLPSDIEVARMLISIVYLVLFFTGMFANDYSNLRRIGLDEYCQPLTDNDKNMRK